ncbi:MAG: acyl-CoA dehydrogenase family protein [Myxococcota bacterium]|nr:acyl-CoA dehydrogenase family protein [Myxococcota bacterium]
MNFDLSEEQQMVVDTVAKWVEVQSPVKRFRKLREADQGWEPDIWRAMGEYGWLGVCYPEERGGFGGNFVDAALILEQLGRGLVPEPFIPSVALAGGLLERLGTGEQHERFLTPMLDGMTSLALAYAERQSRYQLNDCLTTAHPKGGDYMLVGEKTWVLNGHAADQIVVVARTGGDQLDENGLSLFIVDADTPNLRRVEAKGMDGQTTALLRFEGVEVPRERLLGELDAALPDLEWAIDRGAAAACAEGQGCVQELFDRTVSYLKTRKQFDVPIGRFQALQHRAADMFTETELCRSTALLAAIQVDSDDIETRKAEVSAAKLQLTRGGWYVQENAIQLFGGIAITDEQDEGLFFKRLRVLQGLFGDADHHIARFQQLERFDAPIRSEV